MVYLHKSKLELHGNLSSETCFVNSRWVLKIGGFRPDAFREDTTVEQVRQDIEEQARYDIE